MVWKNNGNAFIFNEGKLSFATIITPFWSNRKDRRKRSEESACISSIEETAVPEDQTEPTNKEVRDRPFVLTHLPSEEVLEILIKDSSTFLSSFDSSEEVAAPDSVKSAKSFSDSRSIANRSISGTLSVLPSLDSKRFLSADSFTEGSSESLNDSYILPVSRTFSSRSVKSVSSKSIKSTSEGSLASSLSEPSLSYSSLDYSEKKRGTRVVLPQTDHIVVKTPTDAPLSNILKEDPRVAQHQKVLALFQRLDEFQKKGCLTQQDYEHYHQLLKKYKSDFYIRKINTYLDRIAKRELREIQASIRARKFLDLEAEQEIADTHSIMAETMGGRKKDVFPKKGRVSWGDNQMQSLTIEYSDEDTKTSYTENKIRSGSRENNHAIVEPEDLWSGNANFDEQQLQELFVEMCFFARLGYAQPPCCLNCTYKETKGQGTTKDRSSTAPPGHPSCRRWVVWRKNADTLLHPNKLDGNILIMHCNVAQKLLDGKVVGGRRWNAEQRRVTTLSTA